MSSSRPRNFAAEYRLRIANAQKRGLSRSQARGHARSGEAPIRPKLIKSDERLEAALKLLHKTGQQGRAAKEASVSPERFRRFLRENGLAERRGRTWLITDNRKREMTVITGGEALVLRLPGFGPSSRNGEHLNAVKKAINENQPEYLRPFGGEGIRDDKGQLHLFETDLNALYRLAHAGSEVFHDVYRLIS